MVVVGDKSYKHIDEGPIRAGRRTRSPMTLADDSSNSDNEDGGMRVGSDYQAVIPECNPNGRPDTKNDAMLVWAPCSLPLPEEKIDEYTQEAKEKHGYNMEQALGMLFWHKHSIEKALNDLPNFTPFPDEWTTEDRVLFEQAFSFHGKSFHRIRQMLPDKSIGCLVKFYYSWKKTRSRTSLIDRQAHRSLAGRGGDVSEDEVDNSDQLSDTEQDNKESTGSTSGGGAPSGRAGIATSRKLDYHARMKNKRRPPKGMCLNKESLLDIATAPPGQGDIVLRQLQMELVKLRRQVQSNKQLISSKRDKALTSISQFRIPEPNQKPTIRWTNEELLLGVQGVRKYGKDFKAIAEVIGTKSETMIRSFFFSYRRRYNLDDVVEEFCKEESSKNPSNGSTVDMEDTDKPVAMEVDSVTISSTASMPVSSTLSNSSAARSGNTVVVTSLPPTGPSQQQSQSVDSTISASTNRGNATGGGVAIGASG